MDSTTTSIDGLLDALAGLKRLAGRHRATRGDMLTYGRTDPEIAAAIEAIDVATRTPAPSLGEDVALRVADEALQAMLVAADHAGGLGNYDPELSEACQKASKARATIRAALSRVSGRSDLEVGRPASPATCPSSLRSPEPSKDVSAHTGDGQAQGAGE